VKNAEDIKPANLSTSNTTLNLHMCSNTYKELYNLK
jgi:hypothetical protein